MLTPPRSRAGRTVSPASGHRDSSKDVFHSPDGLIVYTEKDFSDRELRLASILMCMVGIGYLFPFSALTNPIDYWRLLFPDFNIDFQITTVFMWSNLCALFCLVVFGGTSFSFTPRIVGGFLGQFLVITILPTSYFLYLSETANEIIVLGLTVAVAIVTAFLDSSVIAISAQYPLRVQEAFQLGVGFSTLIGTLYRDLTKLVFPSNSVVLSSLCYFYVGSATIAFCIVCYFWLLRLNISKKCLGTMGSTTVPDESTRLVDGRKPYYGNTSRSGSRRPSEDMIMNSPLQGLQLAEPVTKMGVLKKIWFNEVLVSVVFTSTLALWPGLVTEMKSVNFPVLQGSSWWSLILLTLFSLLDCVGRYMVHYRGPITKDNIWIACVLRLGFFPLIICSVKGIAFVNEAWSVLLVGGLGFTNGYLGTLSIVVINEFLEPEERSVAGTFTSFFLNTGLVLGATAGLVMSKIVVGPDA